LQASRDIGFDVHTRPSICPFPLYTRLIPRPVAHLWKNTSAWKDAFVRLPRTLSPRAMTLCEKLVHGSTPNVLVSCKRLASLTARTINSIDLLILPVIRFGFRPLIDIWDGGVMMMTVEASIIRCHQCPSFHLDLICHWD
jgi:hypothetical protein